METIVVPLLWLPWKDYVKLGRVSGTSLPLSMEARVNKRSRFYFPSFKLHWWIQVRPPGGIPRAIHIYNCPHPLAVSPFHRDDSGSRAPQSRCPPCQSDPFGSCMQHPHPGGKRDSRADTSVPRALASLWVTTAPWQALEPPSQLPSTCSPSWAAQTHSPLQCACWFHPRTCNIGRLRSESA